MLILALYILSEIINHGKYTISELKNNQFYNHQLNYLVEN